MENVAVDAEEGTRWTVSQAAPIRRVHVLGDLDLFEGDSWVSGGVAANCAVDGAVNLGGQQQWLFRNVRVGRGVENGSWSLVLVGCTGSLREESDGMAGGPSVTREDSPAVRIEKPYIVLQRPAGQIDDETTDGDEAFKISSAIRRDLSAPDGTQTGAGSTATGTFQLRVPRPSFGSDASGPDHSGLNDEVRDFSRVRLASARDDSRSLQEALDYGKDLVLSPGIYHLEDSLTVGRDGQVILGLGYATLVSPPDGRPCIRILSGVRGARIAGVMLEASSAGTHSANLGSAGAADGVSSLLEWGDPSSNDAGDPRNPGAMSDVFARVGGDKRDVVPVDAMVRIHSGNVYGDNLWLWRADHVALMEGEEANFPEISRRYRQTVKGECEATNGLVVTENAVNVTMVGLAVEHATEDQTIWDGEDGKVYFYQCELPYDADDTFATDGRVGYRIGSNVTSHSASGLGIYSNFRDHDVRVPTAVAHPEKGEAAGKGGIELRDVFTVKLDNFGGIESVVNGRGPGVTEETPRGIPLRCRDGVCGE